MNEEQYLTVRHKTVRKANQLIQKSRFSLSLQQQKILIYLISQISVQDEDFKIYRFSIPEFCRVCGLSGSGTNYADLKSAIKGIADKSLWVRMESGKETLLRWIEKARIDERSGEIEIRIDSDMKPYLLQLRGNYTQYEMIYTLRFKSKYSVRLYELIKSIHFHPQEEYSRRFELEELKIMLSAEKYKTFQHFKDRVLIPSVNEINQYSDKNIVFSAIRKGRSIAEIEFTITTKDTMTTLRIKSDIDKDFGTGQLTIWDQIQQADERCNERKEHHGGKDE